MRRSILALTMLLLAATTISAQQKTTKTATATAAATDTVTPLPVDQFSYYLGISCIGGLKQYMQQNLGIDTVAYLDDFMRGFKERAEKPDDPNLKAYFAGLQIGDQVMNQILPNINKQITGEDDSTFINVAEYLRGYNAAMYMTEKEISLDSANAVSNEQMEYYRNQLMEKKYGDNRRAGEEFLAQNAKKDSVVTLPSGLQYKVITAGTGEKPVSTSRVEVNYEGRLIDGTVFDSSYKRNKSQEFNVTGVIPGFSEALQLMPVGSTWEIYVPQELGYGSQERANSPIKPFSTLIFKVELLSIKAKPQAKIPAAKKK